MTFTNIIRLFIISSMLTLGACAQAPDASALLPSITDAPAN